jgi:hypothetical protein
VHVAASADDVVDEVQDRLAALLRLPRFLVAIGGGATVGVTARHSTLSSGAFAAIRSDHPTRAMRSPVAPGLNSAGRSGCPRDFVARAELPGRTDVARGRNRFVTATVFLSTVAAGGHLNYALSDDPTYKDMLRTREDGRWTMLVQPGLRACHNGRLPCTALCVPPRH